MATTAFGNSNWNSFGRQKSEGEQYFEKMNERIKAKEAQCTVLSDAPSHVHNICMDDTQYVFGTNAIKTQPCPQGTQYVYNTKTGGVYLEILPEVEEKIEDPNRAFKQEKWANEGFEEVAGFIDEIRCEAKTPKAWSWPSLDSTWKPEEDES